MADRSGCGTGGSAIGDEISCGRSPPRSPTTQTRGASSDEGVRMLQRLVGRCQAPPTDGRGVWPPWLAGDLTHDADADKKTVCHRHDRQFRATRRRRFRRSSAAGQVPVRRAGRARAGPIGWHRPASKGVRCDVLVISGHYDGGTEFYSDQRGGARVSSRSTSRSAPRAVTRARRFFRS